MKVAIRFLSPLRELIGAEKEVVIIELPTKATLKDLSSILARQYSRTQDIDIFRFVEAHSSKGLLHLDHFLDEGDEVTLFLPLEGG